MAKPKCELNSGSKVNAMTIVVYVRWYVMIYTHKTDFNNIFRGSKHIIFHHFPPKISCGLGDREKKKANR